MRVFLLSALLLPAAVAVGQGLPILEQNPASLTWYRISTPHFRVIYPAGLDSTARRTAQRLEQVYVLDAAGLERRPRPISLVLQNQSTVSNAFVTLFPRHTEFVTTPPQSPRAAGHQRLDRLAGRA